MDKRKYERAIELFELRRMRAAQKENKDGCPCSGCAWFERLGIHLDLEK